MFEKLSLTNFTAFTQLDLEFVPGINVLVGGNATGKTHIMKVLYGFAGTGTRNPNGTLATFDERVFGEPSQSLVHLGGKPGDHDRGPFWTSPSAQVLHDGSLATTPYCQAAATFGGLQHAWAGGPQGPEIALTYPQQSAIKATFIPPMDMLAHTKGFISEYDLREIDFDRTQALIVKQAMLPPLRTTPAALADLLDEIQALLGGPVVQEGERFFIETPNGRLAMPIVAEGLRKLALLWLLIRNGSLEPGTVLFWDEPEANLNPSLLEVVARVLHRLAETGVQVFVATHSYLVLQELELARKPETPYQYICLKRDEAGEISATTAQRYMDIHPNLIDDAYLSVYDRKLDKQIEAAS